MPRRDLYHDIVKSALVKDGWTITADPLVLGDKDLTVFADLGAERLLAAQRDCQKIAVEIKVFGGNSTITDLQKAMGQYGLYRYLLELNEPDRKMYLAIPQDIYDSFFKRNVVRGWLERDGAKLLIFNPNTEELQWID